MSTYFIDLVFYTCLFWKHVRFLDWWISQNFLKTMVSVTIKDSHIILVNVLQRAREQWQPNVPCKIVRSFVSFATKNSYLLTSNGPNDTTLTIHIPPLTWLVWRLTWRHFSVSHWLLTKTNVYRQISWRISLQIDILQKVRTVATTGDDRK